MTHLQERTRRSGETREMNERRLFYKAKFSFSPYPLVHLAIRICQRKKAQHRLESHLSRDILFTPASSPSVSQFCLAEASLSKPNLDCCPMQFNNNNDNNSNIKSLQRQQNSQKRKISRKSQKNKGKGQTSKPAK